MSPSSTSHAHVSLKALVLLLCVAVVASLSVVLASVATAASVALYVSPTGSDSADGTLAHPFRTVARGLSAARPGDTVYVRGGVYQERIKNPKIQSGSASAPITVQNYAGEVPVIQGLLWLSNADYWRIKGIDVTWSPLNAPNEHMVKLTNGFGWTIEGCELWGARSYAALLVAGTATNWRVAGNDIHDTYATNGTNQDHLIYVNTRGTGGVVEGNVLTNSPNGRAIKVGPASADSGTVSDVVIRYNTMQNNLGPSNVQIAWGTSKVSIYRNIMVKPASGRSAVTAYELSGTGNVVKDNVVWDAVRPVDTGVSGLTDGGGNRMVAPSTVTGYGAAAWRADLDTADVSSPVPTSTATSSPTASATSSPTSSTSSPTSSAPTATTTTTSPVTTATTTTSSAVPSVRSSSRASITSGGSVAVAKPTGVQAGDLLVAALAVRGKPQIAAPSGWTLLRIEAVSTTVRQLIFSKVAGSSEPSSYAFSLSSPQSAAIEVVACAGASTVTATSGASGVGTVASAPGVAASQGLQLGFFSVARVASITPVDSAIGGTVVADSKYDVSLQGAQRAVSRDSMSAKASNGTWIAQTALVS